MRKIRLHIKIQIKIAFCNSQYLWNKFGIALSNMSLEFYILTSKNDNFERVQNEANLFLGSGNLLHLGNLQTTAEDPGRGRMTVHLLMLISC